MVLHSNVIKNSVGIAVYVISYVFLQMFSSKQIFVANVYRGYYFGRDVKIS